jgi:hypothetical protein
VNESFPIFNLLNDVWYIYRRNNWMLDLSWFTRNLDNIAIDRPIFLLGNQGGGLTLVSRMLRRNSHVVSATGNHKYWAGADELQNVMGSILPAELTGIKHKAPPHPTLAPPRSWSYASDPLIKIYRKSEKDYTSELESKFKKILKYIIARYGKGNQVRFVDKSQVYTVRLSFIHKLLQDCSPRFVLVTRNPYIECPRAAMGKAGDMKRYASFLSWEERLTLCTQHWENSIRAVLEDRDRLQIDVLIIQFEEILKSPEQEVQRICDFVELDFHQDMLPQHHHKIPFGCHYRDRWYPLRQDVNRRYKEMFTGKDMEIVRDRCGMLAKKLGYDIPF